jgi:hypothetical protein
MTERVLPESLSGEEIRTAILDILSRRLQRDGYLNPNLAYSHFTAKIRIEVSCHDLGTDRKVDVTETYVAPVAEPSSDEDIYLDQADGEIEINKTAPNDMRVETGQTVPVLSHDGDGRPTVKKVKYSRKAVSK